MFQMNLLNSSNFYDEQFSLLFFFCLSSVQLGVKPRAIAISFFPHLKQLRPDLTQDVAMHHGSLI